jgi:hypothetical protein
VWFGPGDTFTAHSKADIKNDASNLLIPPPINDQFKQNHFVLTEPIEATSLLENRIEKEVNWLGVVPIFQKEFDYKNSRSAVELMMNFDKKKVTDLIDEHRPVAARKKFFGLF